MDPLTCTSYTPVILDFTNEAKAWAEYPLMNAGMLFEETASVGGACVFNSKEATAATQRPVLEVTYY
jgi:hypothetical protein